MDDQTIKWAAEEWAALELAGFRDTAKRRETVEEVLKEHAKAHPEITSIETTKGRIVFKPGSRKLLDQKAVTVFLGDQLSQFQKETPTVGLGLEPGSALPQKLEVPR